MLALLAVLSFAAGAPRAAAVSGDPRPRVEVWTDRGDGTYQRADEAHVYFHTEDDGYVTIFRVDTDGQVRVLFPRQPWEDNYVRGGRDYEVQDTYSDYAFSVDDDPGIGYVFGVVSDEPFDYDGVSVREHWDYRAISDVRGDPYVALTDLAQRIAPADSADWDYDITPYYVGQHYQYPRFVCYDCHNQAAYTDWDPYAASCVRFRVVVYDDPYYYPYRAYGGGNVVFTRPVRPEPRFVFKDRDGSGDDRFVTVVAQRPINPRDRRTVTDGGGSGQDIVPQPRRRPPDGYGQQGGDQGGGNGGGDHGRRGQPGQPGQPGNPGNPGNRGEHGNPHDGGNPNNPGHHDNQGQPDRPRGRGNDQGQGQRAPERPVDPPQWHYQPPPRVEPRREPPAPREPPHVERPPAGRPSAPPPRQSGDGRSEPRRRGPGR